MIKFTFNFCQVHWRHHYIWWLKACSSKSSVYFIQDSSFHISEIFTFLITSMQLLIQGRARLTRWPLSNLDLHLHITFYLCLCFYVWLISGLPFQRLSNLQSNEPSHGRWNSITDLKSISQINITDLKLFIDSQIIIIHLQSLVKSNIQIGSKII